MTTSSNSPLKLIAGIRFQLDQLNASNAHHEFEHLCRHLARNSIAPNLLPATGPVAGAGDQGRDFETFTSFVPSTSEGSALFLGSGESKSLVFACSLQRTGIEKKIKADVAEIVRGGRPYVIYFFSNQNISTAVRHRVQQWSLEEHGVRLEVIDALAIAEQLALPKTFWIAEEYLRVPSELFPRPSDDDEDPYRSIQKKWFSAAEPSNYADFVEIKRGLRKSTFNEEFRPDLKRWMDVMERFLLPNVPEELRRRATYEVCVAALRGMNNLDSKRNLVDAYFQSWLESPESGCLQDTTVLLSYCTTAQLRGDFSIAAESLHSWSVRLAKVVDGEIERASVNKKAELLEARAHICQLAYLRGVEPTTDPDETFRWWGKLVIAAKAAPLYPVEDFADVLTHLAPHLGDDAKYKALVLKVEKILQERSKGYVVAEKSRDRAVELLKAGKNLAAIDQLHRARVRWFTGDTLRGSLLALLTLSDAYQKLGLMYAAKYHALGAVFLSARSDDEAIKRHMPDCFYQLGLVQYAAGEWMSVGETFLLFLLAHYSHVSEPDNWKEHEDVQSSLMHYLIARSWAKALGGDEAVEAFEAPLRESQMPDGMKMEILDPPLPLEGYERMSVTEIAAATSSEFWGAAFCDCGATRTYQWSALGIKWKVACDNEQSDVAVVEQFVAVLQIAIAELATSELCLLPTEVDLRIRVVEESGSKVTGVPDNSRVVCDVTLRKHQHVSIEQVRDSAVDFLGIATAIFVSCSALPDQQVKRAITAAFKNELSDRAFLIRPYADLYMELANESTFRSRYRRTFAVDAQRAFSIREAGELRWPDGPGPGYSKQRAREFLENRYRRAIAPIRISLVRYRKSGKFIRWVQELRGQGFLDWQILNLINNAVIDYRVKIQLGDVSPEAYQRLALVMVKSDESDFDLRVPEDVLFEATETFKKTSIAANAKTWSLIFRQSTPNFDALKRLLDVRYFQASDDIPHDDLFSAIESEETVAGHNG